MNEEILNIALKNALAEIKNAVSDVNWTFILTDNGTVISGEDTADPNMTKAASSFQSLAEKASAIGGLDNMLITGDKGKVYVSSINDMYLVAGLTEDADLVYFRTLTGAVLPTVLKVVNSITSSSLAPTPIKPTTFKPTPQIPYTPLKPIAPKSIPSELQIPDEDEELMAQEQEPTEPEQTIESETLELNKPQELETSKPPVEEVPSQQLIVDRFSGLMVKADTVQLDVDILKRWSALLDVKEIDEVDIETFSGKTARCKAKVINDSKLEGRGLVRIPEKTCQLLDVRRGELVRVKPVIPEESD